MNTNGMFSLEGKVALVTGARRGLGRAAAEALAAHGADVIGAGANAMPETQAAIEARGRRFAFVEADLGSREAAKGLAAEAARPFGRIDILVNNAGIIRRAELTETSEADWDAVIQVDLDSLFWLSKGIAAQMIVAGRGGRIVNIASLLSFQGGIRVPAYTAAKHAVLGLTRAMANELAPHRINVNAIAPGYMATDNTEALRHDPDRSRQLLERIPAGRFGEAHELGGAVVFLAGSAASYVTGAVLPVDGGWMAR